MVSHVAALARCGGLGIGLLLVVVALGSGGCAAASQPVAVAGAAEVAAVKDGMYRVAVPKLEKFVVRQKQPVWCWAASAEAVMRYKNVTTSQDELAELMHGKGLDDGAVNVKPAALRELCLALNPDLAVEGRAKLAAYRARPTMDANGNVIEYADDVNVLSLGFSQAASRGWFGRDPDVVVHCLSRDDPPIVGFKEAPNADTGHAVVVVGCTYAHNTRPDARGLADAALAVVKSGPKEDKKSLANTLSTTSSLRREFVLHSVDVYDPWTDRVHTYSGREFEERLGFVISRDIARQTIQLELDAVTLR